jgi:hypothetical protein
MASAVDIAHQAIADVRTKTQVAFSFTIPALLRNPGCKEGINVLAIKVAQVKLATLDEATVAIAHSGPRSEIARSKVSERL